MDEVASLHAAIEASVDYLPLHFCSLRKIQNFSVHGSDLTLVVVVSLRKIESSEHIETATILRNTTGAVGSTLVQIGQLMPLFAVNVKPAN
jgi:hypothetical protein